MDTKGVGQVLAGTQDKSSACKRRAGLRRIKRTIDKVSGLKVEGERKRDSRLGVCMNRK